MHTIAFARGVPAPEMLPVDLVRDAVSAVLERDPVRVLSYGTGGGYGPLREWLAAEHGTAPSNIVVTTGSLHAFALLMESMRSDFTDTPPVVFVENPTYDRPLIVLRRAGYRIRSIPTDANGIIPDALDQALATETPAFIYVIPSFQNPSGATLPNARRTAILQSASLHGVPVIEDDPYGLLHFDAPAPRTLYERNSDATVIYANSYSKTIAPGLRVGYVVLPDAVGGRVERYPNDSYIAPSLLGQAAVHHMLEQHTLADHIDQVRGMLAARCAKMCDALDTYLPQATYHRPSGGYFVWVTFDADVDTDRVLERASNAGVTFVQGSAFGDGNQSSMRLAFSSPDIDDIARGIERIAGALHANEAPV